MQSALKLALPESISESVAIEVRNMIVDGRLPADERINEVHLSQRLGVSRTPLREALAKLEHEGTLRSVPRIGYFVRPLTLEEFEQIYSIRPLLDPEALRLAGLPSKERIAHLRQLNDEIERSSDADAVIATDDEFHLELLAGCPNQVLIELIVQFMRRTRRYELALMRENLNVSMTCAAHRSIIAALARGDLPGACAALRTNLETGRGPIVEWLAAREKPRKETNK